MFDLSPCVDDYVVGALRHLSLNDVIAFPAVHFQLREGKKTNL